MLAAAGVPAPTAAASQFATLPHKGSEYELKWRLWSEQPSSTSSFSPCSSEAQMSASSTHAHCGGGGARGRRANLPPFRWDRGLYQGYRTL